MIRRAGGIDLQILGIGRSGHIGFNEPGSTRHSRTRRITLDPVTRRDAASSFFGEENVPHQAITMGVGTILEAPRSSYGVRRAQGADRARAVEEEMTEAVTAQLPATPRRCDLPSRPRGRRLPDADPHAVARRLGQLDAQSHTAGGNWLSLASGKGLLKLSDDDFREHELYELLREHGPAHRPGPPCL